MTHRLFLLIVSLIPYLLSAQVTTPPLPSERGLGGEALTLAQLKDSALANNRTLRQKRIDIEAAKEQRREAFTKYFPNISGTALWFNANKDMARMDIDPQEFISPELGAALAQSLPAEALMALSSPMTMTMIKNGTIAGVEAILPVFTGGQIINGNKLARVGEEVRQLQLQLSENDVECQVEQYYWQLVSLMEKQRTLDAADALLTDVAKDAETAVEAGVALRNDLLQVQLRQNEIQSQRLKLNNGIQLIQLLLAQVCGLKSNPTPASACQEGESFGLREEDTTPTSLLLDGRDLGVSQLPEYLLLQKNVEVANLQYMMEIGKLLPSLAVGAGYNYHNLLDNNRSFGMVFATASVPISDWWGGSHVLKRKRLEREKAREQLEENAQMLEIRIQSQLDIAQRSIQQADENLRIQRDTYHAGTSTMSDLLQAQLLLQQAKDQYTDAYVALQNARLAYRQAVGM